MKKSVLVLGLIFLVFTLGINLVLADNATQLRQVNEAYSCLNEIIDEDGCSSLGERDQIFAYLTTGKCKDEVFSSSKSDNECWPKERCNIKMTSQAVFALDKRNQDTSTAQEWLLERKMVPSNIEWFLQIESQEETSCNVYYDDNSYSINIGEDKKINSGAGQCLSLGPGDYWLRINNVGDCYYLDYEISCQDSFFTTLLFKEDNSPTIHVLDDTNQRDAGGTTLEKINSFCLSTGSTCNYEDNAWATMVLDILGEDVSSFMPYLITSAEREYFPDPFLYTLTVFAEYRTNIMNQQINNQYWRVLENKYYDTALALLPFQGETFTEKSLAIEWLLSVQEEDGCWEGGNVKDNAFLLYSLWPRLSSSPIIDDSDSCPDNYFCETSGNCESENVLSEYSCFGSQVCCREEYVEPTCSEVGGKVCLSGEYCEGGETYTDGNWCCTGTCKEIIPEEESACEAYGGSCESFECMEGEEDISSEYACSDILDYCCVPEEDSGVMGHWWIWVLFVLIILVIIAIIYRDKLKDAFMNMTHKDSLPQKGGNFPRRPGMMPPPQYNRMPQMRPPIQRKIVPQPQRQMRPPINRNKSPKELDDVLKKLKEMSD